MCGREIDWERGEGGGRDATKYWAQKRYRDRESAIKLERVIERKRKREKEKKREREKEKKRKREKEKNVEREKRRKRKTEK